jgi:hypothetical protein
VRFSNAISKRNALHVILLRFGLASRVSFECCRDICARNLLGRLFVRGSLSWIAGLMEGALVCSDENALVLEAGVGEEGALGGVVGDY